MEIELSVDKLKEIEQQINVFNMDSIDIKSILEFKNLHNLITNLELEIMWKEFNIDLEKLILNHLDQLNIKLETSMRDQTDKPKNQILLLKEKVLSLIKIESDQTKIESLKNLNIVLSNLYIKYEDLEDEISLQTNYLYDYIDEKFQWLDENPEFIQICELLDSISNEIFKNVLKYVEDKSKFYKEYFDTKFKTEADRDMGPNLEIYVMNFIKNYMLNNFDSIFNQICLDILESKGITNEADIKNIVKLHYGYTKQNTKLMLALNDIELRLKITNNIN